MRMGTKKNDAVTRNKSLMEIRERGTVRMGT